MFLHGQNTYAVVLRIWLALNIFCCVIGLVLTGRRFTSLEPADSSLAGIRCKLCWTDIDGCIPKDILKEIFKLTKLER